MTNQQPENASEEEHTSAGHWLHWGMILRTGALLLVILGMLWLVLNVKVPSLDELQGSVDELRDAVAGFGWLALPIFVAAYAAVAVTPIPVTVMAVSAGILFGTIEGSIVSVVGVLIGCWGAYWLARALGHETVRRLLGRRSASIEEKLQDQGFATVFLLRVMPGMPYWPVNYGSGAFGVGQRDFVVASGLAAIPGQISLVAIGVVIVDPSLWAFITLGASWAVVAVMTIWSYRSLRGTSKRGLPGSGASDPES